MLKQAFPEPNKIYPIVLFCGELHGEMLNF